MPVFDIIINHILYVDANPVVSHTSNNPQGVDCISALAGLIRYLCKLIFVTVHLHIYAFFYFSAILGLIEFNVLLPPGTIEGNSKVIQ